MFRVRSTAARVVLFVVVLGSCSRSEGQPPEANSTAQQESKSGYQFSTSWFDDRLTLFEKQLAEWKGKPNTHYLEIGVFEGKSLIWMLDKILTHPTSNAVAVDPFVDGLDEIFLHNLRVSGHEKRVEVVKDFSQQHLRFRKDQFDLIYVDGSHVGKDVLQDLVDSWRLLKVGGMLIADDYILGKGEFGLALRPQLPIDAFVTLYADELEVAHFNERLAALEDHRGNVPEPVFLRKVESPCGKFNVIFGVARNVYNLCERLGKSVYIWTMNAVIHGEEGVQLSEADAELIERYLKEKPYGFQKLTPSDALLQDPRFQALRKQFEF